MFFRILSSGLVVLGVALLMQSTASAQRPNPAMQKLQPITTGGTLILAGPNQLQLSTNTNQTIYVMVMPNTEVSVTGTAEKDYLKTGVNVEFVAEVDKHVVKEKVIHLIVFTPSTDRPIGLSSSDFAVEDKKSKKSGKGPKADGEKANPLVPDPGIDAPVNSHKASKKDADLLGGDSPTGKPAKAQGGSGTFTVRGTIKMFKNGKLTVAAGRGPTIKAELAEDATIDVDMADIKVAQRDDRVTVKGQTTQVQPNRIWAESIEIQLSNPLSGKKHKTPPAKAPSSGKAKKTTGNGDDLLGK